MLDDVSTVQVSGVFEEEDQAQAHLLSSGRTHSLVCGATILELWYTAECMQKRQILCLLSRPRSSLDMHLPLGLPQIVLASSLWAEACDSGTDSIIIWT